MQGYDDQKGVSPRAIEELFRKIDEMKDEWSYNLTFSMLEIYNESILGQTLHKKLAMRSISDDNIRVPSIS
jgi:kinesin family protein C2/C3